jgi:putative DNA primase/helicase
MKTNKLKKAALTSAKMGWHIFPVERHGKKPLTPNGYKDASTYAAKIEEWWAKWPNANIGLACRESGIIAIDIDQDEERGLDGLQTWADLTEKFGIDDNTITSITGRRGYHILYEVSSISDFDPRGKLGQGDDIQVKWHGYIILPPSIHPNGRIYCWEVSHRPDEIDMLPLPPALADLLTSPNKSERLHNLHPSEIAVGGRNSYLTSVAGYWQSQGKSDDELVELLNRKNAELASPLDRKEVESIYRSILRYPKQAKTGEASRLNFSEFGFAERMVKRFGNNIRFCYDRNLWVVWNGHRWEFDNFGAIYKMGKQIIRDLIHEVTIENIKDIAKFVKTTETERQLTAMLNLARNESPIRITDFDCDPWLLNTRQGYINLRTGQLNSPDRLKYMSLCVGAAYDPNAKCPLWEKTLDEIFDGNQQLIRFLQRLLGYSLTGLKTEHVFPLLVGEGRNGKSLILNTVLNILGDYGTTTPPETLLRKRDAGIPNDLAALYGKRFVWASETNTGQILNEAVIRSWPAMNLSAPASCAQSGLPLVR